jgi:hypothetical protein
MPPGSETPPVAAAWVALVRERNDVEAKGFTVQVAGSHLLVGLCLASRPLNIPLPADFRLRPEPIRECTQGIPHYPLPFPLIGSDETP